MDRKQLLQDLIDSRFDGNQADFARAIKRSPSQVNQWLTGYRALGDGGARQIEQSLGLPGYFDGKKTSEKSNVEPGPDLKPLRSVPVVGEVKGGADGYLEELEYPVGHGEGMIEWPTSDACAYALRVRGDSMFPRYRAGEFVVVEPSVEAPLGEDVVVCMNDGRKMLKVLNWIRDGEVQLLSINNGFAPLTISCSDIRSIQYAAGRAPRSALRKL